MIFGSPLGTHIGTSLRSPHGFSSGAPYLGFLVSLIYYLVCHLAHKLNLGSPLGSRLVLHLGSWLVALGYSNGTLFGT